MILEALWRPLKACLFLCSHRMVTHLSQLMHTKKNLQVPPFKTGQFFGAVRMGRSGRRPQDAPEWLKMEVKFEYKPIQKRSSTWKRSSASIHDNLKEPETRTLQRFNSFFGGVFSFSISRLIIEHNSHKMFVHVLTAPHLDTHPWDHNTNSKTKNKTTKKT